MLTSLNYLSEILDKHAVGSPKGTDNSLKATGLSGLFLYVNMTAGPGAEVAEN